MLPIMLTNLGKSSTAGQRIALGGNETVGRKRDLDQRPGIGRTFYAEVRVIGFGQRLSQRQAETGCARAQTG
jgi:hypothetical protein